MKKRSILVTGATGYIGRLLAHQLLGQGHKVTCMVRDQRKLDAELIRSTQVVEADVFDPQSLEKAMRGVEVAYYLIHSMGSKSGDFKNLDIEAAENFGKVAEKGRLQRIIYLGGLGSEDDDLSKHLQSRQDTGNYLRKYKTPVTEFRAGSIVGAGSLSFEMIRYLVERLPLLVCPRWVNGITQPIAVDDVLKYLTLCLETPESVGQTLEIGGKDKLSYLSMMQTYARVRGLKRFFINVPLLTPRLSALWLRFVTPLPSDIAKPIIRGIRAELFCRDERAKTMFDFQPTSYIEAVNKALTRDKKQLVKAGISHNILKSKEDKKRKMVVQIAEGAIIENWIRRSNKSANQLYESILNSGGENGW